MRLPSDVRSDAGQDMSLQGRHDVLFPGCSQGCSLPSHTVRCPRQPSVLPSVVPCTAAATDLREELEGKGFRTVVAADRHQL